MTFRDFIIDIEDIIGRSLSQESRDRIYEVAHTPYILATAYIDYIESEVAYRSLADDQRQALIAAWCKYMASCLIG